MDSVSSKLLLITNKVGKLCFLNILYIACCLPVITIGAATSALYSCIFLIIDNEEGYLSHIFFKSFKEHFIESTLAWAGLCISAGFIAVWLFYVKALPAYFLIPLSAVFILILSYLYLLSCHLFAFISRFHAKLRFVLRSCFILVAKHFFLTLILAMMNAAVVMVYVLRPSLFFSFLPAVFFLGFSGIAYINGRILTQIFIKEQLIEVHRKETPDGDF